MKDTSTDITRAELSYSRADMLCRDLIYLGQSDSIETADAASKLIDQAVELKASIARLRDSLSKK